MVNARQDPFEDIPCYLIVQLLPCHSSCSWYTSQRQLNSIILTELDTIGVLEVKSKSL